MGGWDRVGGPEEGPGRRDTLQQPAEADCRTVASRVQNMVSSEPTSRPRAAALQPAGAGCWTAARRVQRTVSSEPARRSPATGRRRLPDGGPQSAEDGVIEAGEPPPRSSPVTGRSRLPDGGEWRRWCCRSGEPPACISKLGGKVCIRRRTGAGRASSRGIGPTSLPPTLTLSMSWSKRGSGGTHVSTYVMLSSAVPDCQKKHLRTVTACCASVTLCQVELDGTAPKRTVSLHQSCSRASALAIVSYRTYPTCGRFARSSWMGQLPKEQSPCTNPAAGRQHLL
jgi:hypothetical protein